MNWVDAAMLGILALSACAGFLRGFARELLGVAAWIIAAVLAGRFYGAAVPIARTWIEDAQIADVACYVVVFLFILIALSVLANLLSRLVRLSLLGGVDRILGLGFGLVRGAVLLVLAYIVLAFTLPADDWPGAIRQARGLPYLHTGARYALAQAPERWRPMLPHGGPDNAADLGQESF